jgi:hypothetical protein
MLTVDALLARRANRRHQGLVRAVGEPAAAAEAPAATTSTFEDAERELTSWLAAGLLSPGDYRETIAALAATDQRVTGVNPLALLRLGREALDRLKAAMPSVPRSTLFAAIALAQDGATVESLMRLLGLTNAQAVKVIMTTAITGPS